MKRIAPLLLVLSCKAPPPPPASSPPAPASQPAPDAPPTLRPSHPDPYRAALGCRFAFSAPPAERAHAVLADCAHIYSAAPSCKDAWIAIANLAPSARPASVPSAIAACAAAYCPRLPETRALAACIAADTSTAAWSALQRAIFRYELGDAEAASLDADRR